MSKWTKRGVFALVAALWALGWAMLIDFILIVPLAVYYVTLALMLIFQVTAPFWVLRRDGRLYQWLTSVQDLPGFHD
jgi:hypothetical protein